MSGRTFFRKGTVILFLICSFSGVKAQQADSLPVRGCTDSRAKNYRAAATVNDGSCVYARTTVKPYVTSELPPVLSGSSGLVLSDGCLYTHNDHRDRKLYRIDTSGGILAEIKLPPMAHRDVEDAASDSLYIYLGDFGNNSSGNRTDLHILRLLKSSLYDSLPLMDTIWFSYPDQKDFTPSEANRTDFDCEALMAAGDSLYLFSKQWSKLRTTLYALPKTPGRYVADSISGYAVDGLITSACYDDSTHTAVLCGYSPFLQPFLLLLYDYQGRDFLSGNKRRILLDLPFHQVEAVERAGEGIFYLSNETFRFAGRTVPARLHRIDLSGYLPATGR